jgi:hypothetical protein
MTAAPAINVRIRLLPKCRRFLFLTRTKTRQPIALVVVEPDDAFRRRTSQPEGFLGNWL